MLRCKARTGHPVGRNGRRGDRREPCTDPSPDPDDGARVRIEQLEYLAAVTQHGSLRRASESLHLSQPALSEAVGKLERELGVPLLDRRRSGARISRAGPGPAALHDRGARGRRPAAPGRRRPDRWSRATCASAPSTPRTPPCSCRRCRTSGAHHGGTGVEVLSTQQSEIYQGLAEGVARPRAGQRAPGRRRAPAPRRRASWSTAARSSACAPTTRSPRSRR